MRGGPWALAFILVVAAGCNKSDDGATAKTEATSTSTATTTTGAGKTAATTTGTTDAAAPAGLRDLKIEDIKPGKGAAAANGDTIWVLYTGKLKNASGKTFDSTENRQDYPLAVNIGGGQVIAGWDKGLVGMKVGGERNLYIPYRMAYGENGKGDTIPPKADLFFNLKAVALVKRGQEDAVDLGWKKQGHGPSPKVGDRVTVSYTGTLPSGTEFDKEKHLSFIVGRPNANGARALPGIDLAVQKMNVGEEAIVRIPPKLGKPTGGPKIPANSVLVFDITLEKIG